MFTAGDPDHTSEPRAVIHVAVVNLDVIHYIDFLSANSANLWSAYIVLPLTLL